MPNYQDKNRDCIAFIVSGFLSVNMYLIPTGLLSSLISINTESPRGMVLTIFLSVSLTYSTLSLGSYSTIEFKIHNSSFTSSYCCYYFHCIDIISNTVIKYLGSLTRGIKPPGMSTCKRHCKPLDGHLLI